jgi:asparagine synthase (glutamine-hydrolysing)
MDNESLLHEMCSCIKHRGPDDAGFYSAPDIGLAMRRLAIIDLNTGNQPISNENRDVWVVFNGEIYNYVNLRKGLIERGHNLVTTSDTETIVHLYEDFGLDFVRHLRGMFGIALWDAKRRRLVLIRDRMGEKPLYYTLAGNYILFGSEIKSILQAGRARGVNPQAVCDFLAAGYVPRQNTLFEGILKIPPGHLLVWEGGTAEIRPYWTHGDSTVTRPTSFEIAKVCLSEQLNEAVKLCLESDVEVGAFLSGGIDSSVIVALMRKHNAKVRTFTVGYGGKAAGFNELGYAKRVAKHLGTDHHELILGPQSSMELLPKILWHYDEPHGEPTSVLVYLLCEFTRKYVKVALSGTGGDEIFFGYPRHVGIRMLELYRRVPRTLRKGLVERVIAKWPESTRGSRFAKRARRFIGSADLPPEEAYLSWVSLIRKDIRMSLISERVKSEAEDPEGERFLRDHLIGADRGSLLEKAAALDVQGYLPEYQLAYMDRMSMAHGLEVRAPLCDYRLSEFVTSLPCEYRLKGRRSKHIFKELARQWIPTDIAERRKVGFDSPIGQWFKGELREFLLGFLSRENVRRTGLLDEKKVEEMLWDHLSGRIDYSLQLWSIVAMEGWHRMYIEDGILNGEGYLIADMRGGGT